jgi:iron(III) transport system ATP-binding protein
MVGVTLRAATKRYGDTVAVDRVDLQVERGELFFLLGPSGCGKTTILRMIAGFAAPDEGSILFDDRPVDRVPAHRRNTGMVFQSYALWPHMDVEQNVAYGLRERHVGAQERTRRVHEALETVRMTPFRQRMPNQLSGGQQQRVALARALVIEPDVVLLDEPLSNLDARLRLEMRDEIRRIHDEIGATMIYVTHDQKEALSMAQRLAVMSMGKVEQTGTPREVYRRPVNRFVAEFVGEANMVEGVLAACEGGQATVRTPLGELRGRLADDSLAPGARVVCMVRPEALHLGAAELNSVPALLEAAVYLGEAEQLVLSAGDLELRAVQANPRLAPPEPGEEVRLHFSPDDAVILPMDAGSDS